MTARTQISRLVKSLRTVPAKRFRIALLAPQLLDEAGHVDIDRAVDAAGDVNLAVSEVERYVRDVRDLRDKVEEMDIRGTPQPGDRDEWMDGHALDPEVDE